jgi:hypothetical protein
MRAWKHIAPVFGKDARSASRTLRGVQFEAAASCAHEKRACRSFGGIALLKNVTSRVLRFRFTIALSFCHAISRRNLGLTPTVAAISRM